MTYKKTYIDVLLGEDVNKYNEFIQKSNIDLCLERNNTLHEFTEPSNYSIDSIYQQKHKIANVYCEDKYDILSDRYYNSHNIHKIKKRKPQILNIKKYRKWLINKNDKKYKKLDIKQKSKEMYKNINTKRINVKNYSDDFGSYCSYYICDEDKDLKSYDSAHIKWLLNSRGYNIFNYDYYDFYYYNDSYSYYNIS